MKDSDFIQLLHAPGLEKGRAIAAEVLSRYFRVEVVGLEHIPKTGPVVLVPNHSGFAGLDAVVLSHEIHKNIGRSPKILAHRAYFDLVHLLAKVSSSFGLTRSRMTDALEELRRGEMLMVFPEAEKGNFKSSFQRYHLQKFHGGAVRMAMATGALLIPTLIIGAEESNLNLGNIDLSGIVKHLVIPMPVNLIPLPAKWRIEFLPPFPIDTRGGGSKATRGKKGAKSPVNKSEKSSDHSPVHTAKVAMELTEQLQRYMQDELKKRLKSREYVYFKGLL